MGTGGSHCPRRASWESVEGRKVKENMFSGAGELSAICKRNGKRILEYFFFFFNSDTMSSFEYLTNMECLKYAI